MTEVEFHTGVADPVGYTCRLLRKAFRKGVRVVVTAPPAVLGTLDRDLWTFEQQEFVPHLRLSGNSRSTQAERTPIWLVDGEPPAGAPDVLVNLGAGLPADIAAFRRVIEIVSADADDEQAGRQRWRTYKARGLVVTHHPAAGRD